MLVRQQLTKLFALQIYCSVWTNGVEIGFHAFVHKKLQRLKDKSLVKKSSTHHLFQHTMEQVASS
jgi:hypothetical protein